MRPDERARRDTAAEEEMEALRYQAWRWQRRAQRRERQLWILIAVMTFTAAAAVSALILG